MYTNVEILDHFGSDENINPMETTTVSNSSMLYLICAMKFTYLLLLNVASDFDFQYFIIIWLTYALRLTVQRFSMLFCSLLTEEAGRRITNTNSPCYSQVSRPVGCYAVSVCPLSLPALLADNFPSCAADSQRVAALSVLKYK